MTGKDIVEALSFVDEKYIEEAENGKYRKGNPTRYLLPLAACLGLILLGLRFLPGAPEILRDENKQIMQEPPQDTGIQIEDFHKENIVVMESATDRNEIVQPNASEAPEAVFRIRSWTEDGFTATLEKHLEAEFMSLGTVMNIKFCVEENEDAEQILEDMSQFREQYPEGTRVRVRYVYYSVETNTLYIDSICKEDG